MSGIFKPHEECPHPRTVLIEGKPGMRKTTYCKKFVYDWATGKQEPESSFSRLETVLLLRCRDMTSNLWEAIDDQLLPRDVKEDVRERFFDFIRHNQSNVLLILDGLDEVPANKLPMFSEIIQGRVLPKCGLVATARHDAGMKVRIHCDTLLEIEGFSEEDARQFIVKYFKTMEDLAQTLLYKLEIDENLNELTANPLNTALLCLVCEEFQGAFPESRTKLYMDIVQCVLRRYIQKKGLPENSADLIEAYKTQFKHLGWIALKGLRHGNLDFEESELGSHSADLPGFGFLSVHPGGSKLRPRRRYSFLHKSFQEFFAAFYLCCQLLDKEISADSFAADRRYFHELKEVIKFTCGMIAARCDKTTEALVKNLTTQVNHEDDGDYVPVVLEGIRECKQEHSDFHLKLARMFGSLLKLQSFALESETEPDVVVLAEVLKGNSSLTKLNLSGNDIGDVGAAGLAEALQNNKNLTELDLSYNYIGDHGATGLAAPLQKNTGLTGLSLFHNYIGDQGAVGLAEALKKNTSLTELDLSENNIWDEGAAGLAEALKKNTNLAVLELSLNYSGDEGATGLAEALKKNTSLTELYLSENNIGDKGAAGLAEALQKNTSLTKLILLGNYIGDQGAAVLAEALQKNTNLAVLNLSHNNIGDEGATGLAEAMRKNAVLRKLHLFKNHISEAVVSELHLEHGDRVVL
ncbi:NLR family CARD domain-containing protein 4-like [Oculina patagonica]